MKNNKVYLLLVLLCTFIQGAKAQDVIDVVNQDGLEYAIEGNSTVEIKLWQNIDLSKILSIGDGKNITIDLNGKTLSRNLILPADDGGVIRVETDGQLTIKDSQSGQNGLITGGRSTNGGGITNHGELTIESGTMMFCEASSSGGAIWNDGTLTINGGVITQNHSDNEGGGIWNSGTLTINGGTISGNQSATVGGGIWNGGSLNMKGYFYIWENSGTGSDGDNISNVFLDGETVVNVTGSFQDGATIGVSINVEGKIITNGYKTHNPNADAATYFHSDKTSNNLSVVDNELILGTFVTFDECSWDAENEVVVTKTRTLPATKLEGSHPDDWTGLYDGYYFVEGNVSYKVLNILGEDVHLVLTDGCELYCNHIKLEEGHTLSIYSQSDDEQTRGKLKAENALVTSEGILKWVYADAAAIGGGNEANMGTLYIHGGHITAQYSRNGALIGGGCKGSIGGRLVIYRGKVYANYSAFGSAIGGGYAASQGGSVFIYGGDVTADAKWVGAGIGGGKKQDSDDRGGNGGIVRIFEGTVHAYGGFSDDNVESLRMSGAGIGGGYRGRGGDVYISGGEVYAYGGFCSAGIGGSFREEGGKLVVSGGTVYATSPNYGQRYQAPAIGGGWYGVGSEVHISGGIVKASNRIIKGDNATAIGGSFEKSDGPLDIATGMKVSYSSTEVIPDNLRTEYVPKGELTEANYGERAFKCQDHISTYVIIEPCQHDKTFIYTIDDEYTHTTTCSLCGNTVKESHDVSSGDCVCGIKAENMSRTFTYYVPGDTKDTYEEGANYTLTVGKKFYLFENPIAPEGYKFIGWQMNADPEAANYNQWTAVKPDVILEPGSPVEVTVDMTNTTFRARFLYLFDAEWEWSENNTEYESLVYIPHPGLTTPRSLRPSITSEEIKDEGGEVIGIHYFGTATLTIDGYTYTFRDEWDKYDRIRIAFADNADNTATLETNNGRHADVTLAGRTFWGDGSWNTICLPFDVADITTTPLHGATIKALLSTDYDEENGTLTLNFGNATTSLSAGTPYIFRYPQPEHYGEEGYSYDKTDPIFGDVVIRSDAGGISGTEYVDFVGSFSPVSLVANDKSVLYLGADNTLYYPSASMTVNSCRAVFRLTHGLTAGKAPVEGNAFTRSFVLNFGDDDNDTTGIQSISDGQWSVKNVKWSFNDGQWYSLDGRKLNGMPTQKGIYINNGRKVVIK